MEITVSRPEGTAVIADIGCLLVNSIEKLEVKMFSVPWKKFLLDKTIRSDAHHNHRLSWREPVQTS
jgi:hypothetical protein